MQRLLPVGVSKSKLQLPICTSALPLSGSCRNCARPDLGNREGYRERTKHAPRDRRTLATCGIRCPATSIRQFTPTAIPICHRLFPCDARHRIAARRHHYFLNRKELKPGFEGFSIAGFWFACKTRISLLCWKNVHHLITKRTNRILPR